MMVSENYVKEPQRFAKGLLNGLVPSMALWALLIILLSGIATAASVTISDFDGSGCTNCTVDTYSRLKLGAGLDTTNVVSWYKFDQNKIYDDGVNNWDNYTIVGGGMYQNQSWWECNGSSYAHLGRGSNTAGEFGLANFSMSLWLKINHLNSNFNGILGKYQGSGNNYWYLRKANNNHLEAVLSLGGTAYTTTTNAALVTGRWYHAVWTVDRSGNSTLYLDGVKQTDIDLIAANRSETLNNSGDFDLCDPGSLHTAGWQMNGSIGEVVIYNKILSSAEALVLYNRGLYEQHPKKGILVGHIVSPGTSNIWNNIIVGYDAPVTSNNATPYFRTLNNPYPPSNGMISYSPLNTANKCIDTVINHDSTKYLLSDCGNDASIFYGETATYLNGTSAVIIQDKGILGHGTQLDTPDPYGFNQSVHPDVLYFSTAWNGYKYWMVHTPYNDSNSALENPFLSVSNNGLNWTVVPGAPHVLFNSTIGHLSDPDLVYNDDTDSLHLYFRDTGQNRDKIYYSNSTNGSTWMANVTILNMTKDSITSPAVVYKDNMYYMWIVNTSNGTGGGPSGYNHINNTIYRLNSTNGLNWSRQAVLCNFSVQDVQDHPWHINVKWIPEYSEYWMLVDFFTGSSGAPARRLGLARSSDGINWEQNYAILVVNGDIGWDNLIYRGSLIYDAVNDDVKIWYSADDGSQNWHIGYIVVNRTRIYEDPDLMLGYNDFSISGWFKVPKLPSAYKGIVGNWGSSGEQNYIYLRVTNANKLEAALYINGNTVNTASNSAIVENQWVNFVYTADRDGVTKLYVDGTLQTDSDSIAAYETVNFRNRQQWSIGRPGSHLANFYLDGTVAHIAIYNRVLQPSEILSYSSWSNNFSDGSIAESQYGQYKIDLYSSNITQSPIIRNLSYYYSVYSAAATNKLNVIGEVLKGLPGTVFAIVLGVLGIIVAFGIWLVASGSNDFEGGVGTFASVVPALIIAVGVLVILVVIVGYIVAVAG